MCTTFLYVLMAHSNYYLEPKLCTISQRHICRTSESMLIWKIQAKIII